MGFSDRNSMAGRLSSISFPDALKRGSSDSATQFTIQITDSNGSPNDPDSAQLYVRVTNAAGVAQDGLLYTDSGLSSAVGASSNATYNNGSSAFWKAASSSSGAVTLFHKTGTASNLEGIYHLEYAWFENDEAVSGSHMFRIVDLADLDDVNVNVGSDSDSSSASGSVHAKIKDVKAAVAGLNDPTAAANADAVWDEAISGHSGSGSTGAALADILADTAAMQPIVAALPDSGALTSLATAAALTAVDTVVDAVLVDTGTTLPATLGSPSVSVSADIAANLTAINALNDPSAAGNADAVWDEALSGHTGSGSAGKALADILVDTAAMQPIVAALPDSGALTSLATAAALALVDGNVDDIEAAVGALGDAASTDYATSRTAMAMIRQLGADINALNDPSAAGNADAAWDEALSGHTGSGSAGKALADILVDTAAMQPIVNALPDSGALTSLATAAALTTVDTVVDGIQTDLSNTTDGLGALKTLIDNVQTAVNAVQNNTRFVAAIPGKLNRPSSGSEAVAVACYLYDEAGNMEDPDSNGLFVKIAQMDGTAIASRYFSDSGLSSAISASGSGTFSGYYPLTRIAAGKYAFFYKNDTGHDEENLAIEFGWEEGSTARYQGRAMQISDAADLDTIKSTADSILVDTATLGAPALASHAADNAAIKSVVDDVLVDTGTTLPATLSSMSTAITTVDTVVDSILVDTGTTLPATLGSPSVSVSADIAANLTAINALNDPTAAANADAVWDEALSGHTGSGSAGKTLADILVDTAAMQPIVAALPDSGALTSLATAAALALVDGNVDDIEAAVGALGDTASADYATTRTAMAMLRKLGADVTTADAAIDAVQVDIGDFSGNTNLRSLQTLLGSRLEAQNVALDSLLMLGSMSIYKVASNSHSGGSGTFTLTTIGSGYHSVPAVDDSFVGGSFSVLAGSNVGRVVMASDFAGGSGQVSYGGLSLADDDIIAFFPPSGYVGKSDDAASSSASDAGKSLFARLRYIGELVASQKAVQRSTFKKHLKRSAAGTLGNDPTDNAESASSTTTSASFEILDVITISFDEGSDASIEDIFAVFKWKHQGTNGGSGGAISTQFYLSGAASAPSAGSALSGVGDAVAVSDAISGTTSASTQSVSGLINQNALNALSNGKIHVLLCGKAASAGDTCTGWIYHSSSLEITYEV